MNKLKYFILIFLFSCTEQSGILPTDKIETCIRSTGYNDTLICRKDHYLVDITDTLSDKTALTSSDIQELPTTNINELVKIQKLSIDK